MKLYWLFFIGFFIGSLAASDSEDDRMPVMRKNIVQKGIGEAKAKIINITFGKDDELSKEDDLRDSFSSINGLAHEEYEAYQTHEVDIKRKYQEALRTRNFSDLEERAKRKSPFRDPFSKAYLSYILLNGLISGADEHDGDMYAYECIAFFKQQDKSKRSGVSLFLKGTLYEYEFRKSKSAEIKEKALRSYRKSAKEFNDDEAQLRLGDWYINTNIQAAKEWYEKAVEQRNERAIARLEELNTLNLVKLKLRDIPPISPATTLDDSLGSTTDSRLPLAVGGRDKQSNEEQRVLDRAVVQYESGIDTTELSAEGNKTIKTSSECGGSGNNCVVS